MKKFFCLFVVILLVTASALSLFACSDKTVTDESLSAEETIALWQQTYTTGMFGIHDKTNPFVELTLSSGDSIRLELYPNLAPVTVENFIKYVQAGFYDGTVFHRVLKGQCIQGGGFMEMHDKIQHKDPLYDEIVGEFASNGIRNDLKHTSGVISMARADKLNNSATSQFFLCAGVVSGWDGNYAGFGKVIDKESMDVITKINNITTQSTTLYYGTAATTASGVPSEIITITKATLVQIK